MRDKPTINSLMLFSKKIGLDYCAEFSPTLLVPEERIRIYCHQNLCDKYGKHYMCPPFVGTIEEAKTKLKDYDKAFLLRYSKNMKVPEDIEEIEKSKVDFHNNILKIENFFGAKGIESWGLIGGSCFLCKKCMAINNKPCNNPNMARPSLESLGIDVQKLLDNFELDNTFYPDRIMWSGCVLIKNKNDHLSYR